MQTEGDSQEAQGGMSEGAQREVGTRAKENST